MLHLLAFAMVIAITAMAQPRVLVFTATQGFRHDSIPTAIQVLGEQADQWNVTFEFTECVDCVRSSRRLLTGLSRSREDAESLMAYIFADHTETLGCLRTIL